MSRLRGILVAPAKAGAAAGVRARRQTGPRFRGCDESGFTLIEMMVALAVFGLAALALIRLEGATLKSTAAVESHSIGQIVANNLAVTALSDPRPPAFGTASGVAENGGRSWRWTQITKRTADSGIVRIDIAVLDADGRQAGALTLARPVG